jgi:hypothetical protein
VRFITAQATPCGLFAAVARANEQSPLGDRSMLSKRNRPASPVCIETLESRQLMSGSLLSHAKPHVKPIPVLTGADFVGVFTLGPATGTADISVTSESSKGVIAGTATGTVGASTVHYTFTGKVTSAGKFSFHAVTHGATVNLTGTTPANGNSIVAKGIVTSKKGKAVHATLSVSR